MAATCANCGKGLGLAERAARRSLCGDCRRLEEARLAAAAAQQRREEADRAAAAAQARARAEAEARERARPTYGINLNPTSVAEAKLSIKELRLRKKELQAEKREIASEATDVREEWRERQAGRISTVGLGRGTGGRMIRAGVQAKRTSERESHARTMNRYSDAKQEVDARILDVDRAIASLERYVLQNG